MMTFVDFQSVRYMIYYVLTVTSKLHFHTCLCVFMFVCMHVINMGLCGSYRLNEVKSDIDSPELI